MLSSGGRLGVLEMRREFASTRGEGRLDLASRPPEGLLHGPFALFGNEEECARRYYRQELVRVKEHIGCG